MTGSCTAFCPVCGQALAGDQEWGCGQAPAGGGRSGAGRPPDRCCPDRRCPDRRCPNRWCRRVDREFSVAFAVGLHQGALRGAITRYKYRGERALAGAFAATLATYLAAHPTWFEEFDLITAVPSYLGAGARRSWDPVGRILAALPDRLQGTGGGWTVLPGAVVKRCETPGMAGLSWAERQAVASGPLRRALLVPDPGLVADRQILVIDDVLTEGSTLREVARALRRAGASDVAGLVLARPPWLPAPPAQDRSAAAR